MLEVDNKFKTYELTKEELKEASIFNDLQRANLQNLTSKACLEKLALVIDPQNTSAFIQREAELQGNIIILQHLLNLEKLL